jgi:hypothetical protein
MEMVIVAATLLAALLLPSGCHHIISDPEGMEARGTAGGVG